ncbi:MAG: DUF2087 domain-containing protein, partial [Rhodospirillaceae bacterium]|nr:DUF2087 domain-containing protein [Rhodospirillaceae bacterium]
MSKTILPFHVDDLSALARALGGQLRVCDHVPSHLELLNMLARAGGNRNFQHLRAQIRAQAALEDDPPRAEPVDYVRVRRAMRLFNAEGGLLRWPPKLTERKLCLWVLWAAFPARCGLAEREVNRVLNMYHTFGDHALLRRWLCDLGMMERTRDGSVYHRVEQRLDAEARVLIGVVARRWS